MRAFVINKNCRHFETEQEVVSGVVQLLKNAGYRIRIEVPSLGQSADMVATRSRWVTFIEAKTRDWRKALTQCEAHKNVADYIAVAVATVNPPTALLDIANERGYGVIHCQPRSGRTDWLLTPRRNDELWRPQRLELSKALRNIDYEH